MNKQKKIKSVKIEGLDCTIGKQTKKYNTVTMRVDRSFIIEAMKLFEEEREGHPPESGLVSIELVAVYSGGSPEPDQKDLIADRDGGVVGEDLIDGIRGFDINGGVKKMDDILTQAITEEE